MNRVAWTVAALRVLAIYSVIQLLMYVPNLIAAPYTLSSTANLPYGFRTYLLLYLGTPIMMLVVAVGLWLAAPWLASLVWRDQPAEDTGLPPITASEFQQGLIMMLGLWLLVRGVESIPMLSQRSAQTSLGLLELAIPLVAGIVLMFGAKGIAQLVTRARTAGLPPHA